MALVLADRVKDTTTTTGTGTITLSGTPPVGYQAFSVVGDGNTTYYAIVGTSEWEVGIGTYTSSGTTLARTTVLASSNSGSLVNFSVGSKDVFVTYPASVAFSRGTVTSVAASGGTTGLTWTGSPITTSGTLTLGGTLAVANGGTGVTTSTGSGNNVLSTSPTLVTPILGTPTSGTLTNCTFPTLNQNTTGTAAKATNLVGGNTTTLLGSIGYQSAVDTTTLLSPNTTTTKKYLTMTGSGTNGAAPIWDVATVVPIVSTVATATSITPTTSADIFSMTMTGAAGTFTINNPTGSPADGQIINLRLKCTNVQTLSLGANYRGSQDLALPSTTSGSSKTDYLAFQYNLVDTKWDYIGKNFGF